MKELILQRILAKLDYHALPHEWRLASPEYSPHKRLWSFQLQALQQAIKTLYLHFHLHKGSKHVTHQAYLEAGLPEGRLDIRLKQLPREARRLAGEYGLARDGRIPFREIVNRASFWMATGSGKTLVIIKLADTLRRLAGRKRIPYGDILILTHRDDLISQLHRHLDEYNTLSWRRGYRLNMVSLRDYHNVIDQHPRPLTGADTIFYYRSDLLATRRGPKRIDFREIESGGNWYVILDEAHRGDKEESTRQLIYTILSRNRMLFNFSATLVDPRDRATTAYNFNLERLITSGYGKHLYVYPRPLKAYHDNYTLQDKLLETMQLLVLHTHLIRTHKLHPHPPYHNPLLVVLVHTVNKPGSPTRPHPDLQAFIQVLEHIAGQPPRIEEITRRAADTLAARIEENPGLLYTGEACPQHHDTRGIRETRWRHILQHVFNTAKPGPLEVLLPQGEPREALLRVQGAENPFALIRIGDAHRWTRRLLPGRKTHYIHGERGFFEELESKEHINMLLGSRGFYEGWDSTRPNIIAFINIGVGVAAQKFVVQSIGRGLRIQPYPGHRRRLTSSTRCEEGDGLPPLETLYVLGTGRQTLHQILRSLEEEKTVNPPAPAGPAFHAGIVIPRRLAGALRRYYQETSPTILMLRHGLDSSQLQRILEMLADPESHGITLSDNCTLSLQEAADTIASYSKASMGNP